MSILVSILVGFAFYTVLNSVFGDIKSSGNYQPSDKEDEDIKRLREMQEYDRWENAGRKDSSKNVERHK